MRRVLYGVLAVLGVTGSGANRIAFAHATPGQTEVKIDDLGGWQPHGNLTDILYFQALPSGRIAYTLWNPRYAQHSTWSRIGTKDRVKDIAPTGKMTSVTLVGMNRNGVAVGNDRLDVSRPGKSYSAAFIFENGRRRALKSPGAAYVNTVARGIDGNGTVWALAGHKNGGYQACRWVAGRVELLRPPGGAILMPQAVNDAGMLLATVTTPGSSAVKSVVLSGTEMLVIDLAGWEHAELTAINRRGDTAGSANRAAAKDAGAGPNEAIIVQNGVVRGLGSLDGRQMRATGLDDTGRVVGTASLQDRSPEKARAFIWDEKNGMRDLNSLLPAGSEWVLRAAFGIDGKGGIYGTGMLRGKARFFRLTLPAGG